MRHGPLIAALVATFGPMPAMAEDATLTDAVELVRRDKPAEAVAVFQRLAERGDTRAQYLLGMTYLEGKMVPLDVVLGYAWLQVAAADNKSSSKRGAADEAHSAMLKVGPLLPGATLIQAEQKAAALTRALEQRLASDTERATLALRSPATAPGAVMSGCALEPAMRGCEEVAGTSMEVERCTGDIVSPDLEPSTQGPTALIIQPEYPQEARRRVQDGTVGVLAHVDRSGYVCRVTLLQPSGVASIDGATLSAVRRWRLVPGKRGGEPVEAIFAFWVSFGIEGLNFN